MSTPVPHGAAADAMAPETRLKASRQALRAAMLPPPPDASGSAPAPAPQGTSLPARVGTLLSHPVLAAVRDGVRRWWHKRAWRPAVIIGAEVARKSMVPLARRHPARLLGGAMLAGAVLSRIGPWKWIARRTAPALLASILPSLAMRLAPRIPLSTLLQAAGLSPAPAPAPASAKKASHPTVAAALPPTPVVRVPAPVPSVVAAAQAAATSPRSDASGR